MSENESKQPLSLRQQRAFDEVFKTLATPGMTILLRQWAKQTESIANVRNTQNLDFAKGQLAVLDTLAHLKDLWEHLQAGVEAGKIDIEDPEFGYDPGV